MKKFLCNCGSQIFFDNNECLNCGIAIGFDTTRMTMVPLDDAGDLSYCDNGSNYGVCNWLRPTKSDHSLCMGCQFNRTIPDLTMEKNLGYWKSLEEAKKRLLYTLMRLRLPLVDGWRDPEKGLLFDFLEDARSNPEAYPDSFVSTGHMNGVVTINVMEADDVVRTSLQVELREYYRTLLGHFRHESGHYYWDMMTHEDSVREEFITIFGNDSLAYREAMDRYYETGAPDNWPEKHISAYASSHPVEDWAESWGHYLHIYDALETASSQGFWPSDPEKMAMSDRLAEWQELSIGLNEVNRSMGRADAYPFVISNAVASKLRFVESVINRLRIP